MKRKLMLWGAAVLAAAALTGCGGGAEAQPADATQPEEIDSAPQVESVEAYGVVEATAEQSISVDFNARVDEIHAKAGERIEEGAPLVTFDISVLEDEIASKKMEIEEVEYKLSSEDYSADVLALDLSGAKRELEQMGVDLDRQRKLHESGAISSEALEKAVDAVAMKRQAVERLELTLGSTRSQVESDRQTLRNRLERLQDELVRLEDKYSKANFVNGNQIVSKIRDGVVVQVQAKEGEYVNREISVMTVVDLDSRIVKADIAEEFIGRIMEGQAVTVTSQAVPGKTYEGHVVRIWGTSIKKGGETIVPIEIVLDDMDDSLLLNFSVDVKIELD